jgi:gamma-glutamyl hydrolase
MASYINILESSGARTVPLIYDKPDQLKKIDSLNGVFYCGGGAGGEYDVFGRQVYDFVKDKNDAGEYLPIWGTCLGFENLAMFASDDNATVLIGGLQSDDENYVLEYTVDPTKSRLFGPMSNYSQIFAQKAIAYNHHSFGVAPSRFATDKGLASIFSPVAISHDNEGNYQTVSDVRYTFCGSNGEQGLSVLWGLVPS